MIFLCHYIIDFDLQRFQVEKARQGIKVIHLE